MVITIHKPLEPYHPLPNFCPIKNLGSGLVPSLGMRESIASGKKQSTRVNLSGFEGTPLLLVKTVLCISFNSCEIGILPTT